MRERYVQIPAFTSPDRHIVSSTKAAGGFDAELAGSVFFSVCINSKGKPEHYAAGEYKLMPLPPDKATLFLAGNRGKAWFSLMAPGNLVLTVQDNGICSVHVRRVNTELATKEFLRVIYHYGKKKKLEEQELQKATLPYGTTLTRTFFLLENDGAHKQTAVLTVTDADSAPLQALMSINNNVIP